MRDSPVIRRVSLFEDASAYLLVNTIRLSSFFLSYLKVCYTRHNWEYIERTSVTSRYNDSKMFGSQQWGA